MYDMINEDKYIGNDSELRTAWEIVSGDDKSYNLANTVRDWRVEDLLDFAHNGYGSEGFRGAVRSQMLDSNGDLNPLPQSSDKLYRLAYVWCTQPVMERLADIILKGRE